MIFCRFFFSMLWAAHRNIACCMIFDLKVIQFCSSTTAGPGATQCVSQRGRTVGCITRMQFWMKQASVGDFSDFSSLEKTKIACTHWLPCARIIGHSCPLRMRGRTCGRAHFTNALISIFTSDVRAATPATRNGTARIFYILLHILLLLVGFWSLDAVPVVHCVSHAAVAQTQQT